MDDNLCLNKEFIIKDEHSSDDYYTSEGEHDDNDPLSMLQVKNHQLDKNQDISYQVVADSNTNETQRTIQDYDSDENLAGIQMKLRKEQKALLNSKQLMQGFDPDEGLEETPKRFELKKGRPTVTKPPAVTNQPTLSKECAICQKHFVCRQDFINHARKYHPNGKAFRCNFCSMVFVNIHSVSRHSKNHKTMVKKHVCEYCSKSFLHRDTYKRHIEIHNKRKIYSCSECGNSYKHKHSLKSHQKTHLEKDNNGETDLNLACQDKQISLEEKDEEGISLTNIPNIKQEEHKTATFDLQADLELNSVMDVTKTEYVEETNLLEVQNEGEIYKIEYVDEQHDADEFENNSNTNDSQHLQMPDTNITNAGQLNTESKPYKRMLTVDTKCAVCHQEFTIRQDLIDHVQQYHPNDKAFKCSICSMRFSNILSIARHRRVHKNIPKTVCPYCSKSFLNKDDYKRHITKVHSIQIANNLNQPAVDRKCAVCHEEFNLRQDLIKHAQEFHPKEKAFKCTVCSMVFKNIHYISRHRRNHKTLPRKYHCELCFKSYRDLDSFKRHLKVHNIGTTYRCSLCNLFFKYKVSLRNHELMHSAIESLENDLEKTSVECDPGKKSIEGEKHENSEGIQKIQKPVLRAHRAVETKCAVCKKDFKYRQDLMKHAQLEHPNDRAFKCSICPRVFKNIHYLSTHRRVHKNLPRKHVCKICSKSFRDQDNFTRHLRVHTRTRIYACSLCNKSYKHKISLENHKKTHLEKPLKAKEVKVKKMRKPISAYFQRPVEMKCAVCQQVFDYRFELVNHVQLNHPHAKAYKCGLCPMVFANIVAVSHHRNIHKIFDCKLCSKSFTCKDDLKLHIRIHTIERPYCCFICKTTYKRRDSWLKHKTCHCKSNKTNEHNKGLKTQNENDPDIIPKNNSIADSQNELEDNSEHIEDEKILQIKNDEGIHKKYYTEDDRLEDNFNRNEEDNDDFLLEKMTNQTKTSEENEKYAVLEDDLDYSNDDKKDEDCSNDDDDDDYNVDNDDEFLLNKETNYTKRRADYISNTNNSQQIILTDDEDDYEDNDHEDDDYSEDHDEDDEDILQEKQNPKKPHPRLMLVGHQDTINTHDSQKGTNYDLGSGKLPKGKIKHDSNMSAVDTKCAVCHQEFDSRKMLTKHAEKYHPNDDAFKCKVCLLLFKSIHAIASHVRSHGRQIIDKKCGVCHKEFTARHELVKHAKEFHPNERAIKCALCPRVFKSTTCMSSHRRSHKNMPKKYVCNACNTSYSDIGNYKAHLKSFKHKFFSENRQSIISEEGCAGVEPQDTTFQQKLICPFCSLTLTHKDDFRHHLKAHTGTSEYRPQLIVDKKCAVCQKDFKCRQDLLDHVTEFHPNDKALKCALCPMVFQHISSITGHRRRVHKFGHRKHFCKVCKKYVSQDSVRSHLKTNKHKFFLDDFQKTISKKFSEEGVKDNITCETTISNENNKETSLKNSEENHSKHEPNQDLNKIIISNELDKDTASFSDCVIKKEIDIYSESKDTLEGKDVFEISKTELINDAENKEDKISIENDTSQNSESCDDGYILESLTNMEEFSKDCSKTRECKICGESFISQSHLRRHYSKHSEERPYQCSFCYRRYKRRDDMRTHQRKVHLDLLISLAEKTIETDRNKVSRVMNNKEVFRSQTRRYSRKHSKERPFKCSFCYRRFKRKNDLETHQTNFHFDLLNQLPNKSIDKEENLNPLPETTIDKEDNLKDINGKEVAKSHLRSYLSIHLKERPFKCTFCYRRYSRKDFMKAHQKKCHSDRLNSLAKNTIDKEKYLKVLNDKDVVEKANDEIIILTANQDKETKNLNNAKTVIEELSPKITQTLDTPKENVCKICYIPCSSKASMIRHLTAHSNERPYNCSYCMKTFKRKDDRKAHEKRMHYKYYIADQNKKAREFVAENFEDNSNTFAQFKDNPTTFGESNTASIKSSNSPNYKDNQLFNEDIVQSENILENTDEIQCHKNTTNISEESFSVNVLEITKSEYVCNEPISFHIQEIEDPINPGNELPNDSINSLEILPNKTTDFNECKVENLGLYQGDEKYLPNEYHLEKAVINDNEHLTESLSNFPSTSQDLAKKHVCDICSKSFYSKMDLRRHYNIHTSNKCRKLAVKGLLAIDSKCAVCEKEFMCRQDFIKHAEHHHPNDKAFKCNLCPMLFSNVSSIPRHRREFHKESAKEKCCPYCSETFNRRDYFQKHLQEHRKSFYNSTQDDLSFNEESNEETISQDNNRMNESLKSSIEYEQTNKNFIENELDSEYTSEEEAEQVKSMKLKNSFENMKEHYTDDSLDDSDIEECETSTSYSQQNTNLLDESANYSLQNTYLGDESIGRTSTNIKIRGKKPPMLDNKCAICFQVFDFQRDLVHHAQQYHPSAKALKCRDCDVSFSHHGSVSRHFRIHKKLTKKYVCEFCFKSFPFKDYLKTHLRVHTTFKGAHSCNICGKSYKHMDSLLTHQKIHSQGESNECDKVSDTPKKVEIEESTTTTSNAESVQIKQTKPLENNSPVNEARAESRIFRNISETLTRFKSRHKLLEGKCAFCKMVINSYQDFVNHLEKFHPEFEAFKCKKCDNRFSNTKSLSSHMYFTHNENRKKHICQICSKSFDRSSNLRSHINIHTEERPFACNVCEKFFKDNRDLKRHQKIHLKRKPKDLDETQQLTPINDIKEETMNFKNNQYIKNEPILNDSLEDDA